MTIGPFEALAIVVGLFIAFGAGAYLFSWLVFGDEK
jgi:hypothetical protein